MTDNPQPRPDLDAAIDAVLPSITAAADEAVAASLRRTRVALAGERSTRQGVGMWRWGLAGAAATVVVAAGWLAVDPDRGAAPPAVAEAAPTDSPLVLRRVLPAAADAPAPAPESRRIAGTAVPPSRLPFSGPAVPDRVTPIRRADPLLALMDAVQAIPDDAWDRGVALVQAPVPVPHVPLEPIAIAPLETPPISDATPAESLAPGEP